jgi:hypothetical protein
MNFKVGDRIKEKITAYDVKAWGGLSVGTIVKIENEMISVDLIVNFGYISDNNGCYPIYEYQVSRDFTIISEKEFLSELLKSKQYV